jgi:hypothetical protein
MLAGPWIMPNELASSSQEIFDSSLENSHQMIHKSNLTGIADFNVDDILSSVGIMPVSSQDNSLGFFQRSSFGSALQDNVMSDGSTFDVHTLTQTNLGNHLNVECFGENLMNESGDGQMNDGNQSIFMKNLPPGLEIVPIGPATSSGNQLDNSLMNESLSLTTMNGQSTNEATDDLFSLLSNAGTSSQKCLSLVLPSVQEFVPTSTSESDQALLKAVEPFPTVNDDMFIEDLFINETPGDWIDKSREEEMNGQFSIVILADNGIPNMEQQQDHGLPHLSMEPPRGMKGRILCFSLAFQQITHFLDTQNNSLTFDLHVDQPAKPSRAPRKRKPIQKNTEAIKIEKGLIQLNGY